MPKLKLDTGRTIIAAKGAQFLFTVHIKVKYGWTGDLDTTLLVLADTHEQARRAAAARLVVKEGISLPLDDNHFSETLVGAVERAPQSGQYSDQEWLNAGAPAEPEVSPEEFKQLWQGVCEAPRAGGCTCYLRTTVSPVPTDPHQHHVICSYRQAALRAQFGLPAQD